MDLSPTMHLGIWVSGGLDSAGLSEGLDDLGRFFQPEWFYDFMLSISACSISKVTSLHSSHSYSCAAAVTQAVDWLMWNWAGFFYLTSSLCSSGEVRCSGEQLAFFGDLSLPSGLSTLSALLAAWWKSATSVSRFFISFSKLTWAALWKKRLPIQPSTGNLKMNKKSLTKSSCKCQISISADKLAHQRSCWYPLLLGAV